MSSSYQTKTFVEITRERTEELRKREAERYETLLRERLRERYPNPSPEEKRKIEARIQTRWRVMAQRLRPEQRQRFRHCDGLRSSCNSACNRYPDLSSDQSKRLQERIAQAVEKERGRIVQTRGRSLDNALSALVARLAINNESFMSDNSDNSFTDRY